MAKRQHKKRVHTVRIGETPTPERRRQNGGVNAEVVDRDVSGQILIQRYKATAECPLDIYFLEGRVSEAEYKAGVKFRTAYFRAVLRIKVDDVGGGGQGDVEMAALTPIYSEKLLREAYEALSTQQKARIIAVCGHEEWAGDTYRVETLRRGLEKLSDLWALA